MKKVIPTHRIVYRNAQGLDFTIEGEVVENEHAAFYCKKSVFVSDWKYPAYTIARDGFLWKMPRVAVGQRRFVILEMLPLCQLPQN